MNPSFRYPSYLIVFPCTMDPWPAVQLPISRVLPEDSLYPSLLKLWIQALPAIMGQALFSQPAKREAIKGQVGREDVWARTIVVALSACSFAAWATQRLLSACYRLDFAIPNCEEEFESCSLSDRDSPSAFSKADEACSQLIWDSSRSAWALSLSWLIRLTAF